MPAGRRAIRRAWGGKRDQNTNCYFDIEKCKICPLKEGCYKPGVQSKTYWVSRQSTVHYDTLAGLISEIRNNASEEDIQEGDHIDFEYYTGTVLKMYRNSVESIQLVVKPEFMEESPIKESDSE